MNVERSDINAEHRLTAVQKVGVGLAGLVGCTLPAAGAVVAADLPGAEHIRIAGQEVTVRPEIGQDTVNFDNLAILDRHGEIPITHQPIGLDIAPQHIGTLDISDPRIMTASRQIASDPAPQIDQLEQAAEKFLIRRGLEGAGAVFGLELAGLALLRVQQRRYQQLAPCDQLLIRDHNRCWRWSGGTLVGIMAGSLVLAGTGIASRHVDTVVHADPQLEQLGIHGVQLEPLAAKAAPIIISFLPYTKNYYDNLATTAKAEVVREPVLQEKPTRNVIRFGIVDDFQNTTGMAHVIGSSFHGAQVDHSFVLGDWTDLGTAYEDSVLDSFLYYLTNQTPVTTMAGLHDTSQILHIAKDDGMTIANNRTSTVSGIRVLGLNDPRLSLISSGGHGYRLRDGDVAINDFINDATSEICRNQPDIVMLHGSDLAERLITSADAAGCTIGLLIDGRSYDFNGPHYYPNPTNGQITTELTLGSGGGHDSTDPDPGIIQHDASAGFLDIDASTGAATFWLETAHPAGSVSLHRIALPILSRLALQNVTEAAKSSNADDAAAQHPLTVVNNR